MKLKELLMFILIGLTITGCNNTKKGTEEKKIIKIGELLYQK